MLTIPATDAPSLSERCADKSRFLVAAGVNEHNVQDPPDFVEGAV